MDACSTVSQLLTSCSLTFYNNTSQKSISVALMSE